MGPPLAGIHVDIERSRERSRSDFLAVNAAESLWEKKK